MERVMFESFETGWKGKRKSDSAMKTGSAASTTRIREGVID